MFFRENKIILGVAAVCAIVFYFSSIGFCVSDLEVSGVFLDTKGNMALINGLIVSEGGTVEGAKVVKITEDGVVFSRDGQEFSQRLSRSSKRETNPVVSVPSASSTLKPSVSSVKSSPMTTLYGMPIENFFPNNETIKQEIQQSMPIGGSLLNPATAQQMLQKANDLKAQSDAKRREIEQRIKEMEGE